MRQLLILFFSIGLLSIQGLAQQPITDFQNINYDVSIETFTDTLELRYRGLHFGDHPITTYEKIDKYYVVQHNGKRMWAMDRAEIHDDDKEKRPKAYFQTIFDTESMLSFKEFFKVPIGQMHQNMSATKDSIFYDLKFGLQKFTLSRKRTNEQIGFWNIDAYLMHLPLEKGFEKDVIMINHNGRQILADTMKLKVIRKQAYRIEKQDIPAYRVSLTNTDSSKTMNNVVYLVSEAQPRIILRKEYVVHRKNEGSPFDSTGTDCLVSIQVLRN